MNIQGREYYWQVKSIVHIYASIKFLEKVIKKLKYKTECVQTGNEFEFANRLNRFMS